MNNVPPGATPLVTVVIANWNGEAILETCLSSLYEQTREITIEVLVIDDASTDGSVDLIRRKFPLVQVFVNEINVGYAATNNRAMPFVKGKYLLLLNNDTVIENDAVSAMADFLEHRADVGICGGRLLNPDGSNQHSCGSFPSIWTELWSLFPVRKFFPALQIPTLGLIPEDSIGVLEVDMIVGAALMIRTSLAKALKLYDETFVAYCEDTDLCYRAKASGWRVMYIAKPRITHLFGYSYGNESRDKAERKVRRLETSIAYFCRKHNAPFATAVILFLRWLAHRRACWTLRVQSILGSKTHRASMQHASDARAFSCHFIWKLLTTHDSY